MSLNDNEATSKIEKPVASSSGVESSVDSTAEVAEPMLLILSKHERSVKSTASFLNRRGVPARYISNLNEAIEAFTAKKANMLLLSVNFPHPKIEMIPALINQSFNIEVIVFAEETDRKSTQKLQSVKTRHVIQGPVSGPTVLMRIRQIEKDLAGDSGAATGDGSGRTSARANEQDQSINVRGGTSVSAKQEALASLMSAASEKLLADDDAARVKRPFGAEDEGADESSSLQSSGTTYVQKGTRSKSHLVTPEAAMRAAIEAGLEETGSRKAKLIVPLPEEMRKSKAISVTREEMRKSEAISPLPEEPRKTRTHLEAREKYQRKQQAAESHNGLETEEALEREARAQERAAHSAERIAREQDLLEKEIDRQLSERTVPVRKRPETDEEDLFLRCILDSLLTVVGDPDDSRASLHQFRRAMLVSVRSPKLQGSFLIGVGHSKHKPQDLMERLQVAFFSLLRANGIDLSASEQFSIELDQTLLAKKAFALSPHILIAETDDMEIGIAVVSAEDPVPQILPYEKNMLQVPLADIPSEEPITFNIFIHLKLNNRFLRYVRVGSAISSKQVTRLERFKITHVLVDGKEQEAYSRHYAAHSIQPSKRRKTAA